MSGFLAIVGDTWRQSRSQVVFIILIVLLVLLALAIGLLPKRITGADGEPRLGIAWSDEAFGDRYAAQWTGLYAMSLALDAGEEANPFADPNQAAQPNVMPYLDEAREEAESRSLLSREVDLWVYFLFRYLFYTCSILLFIAACSGFYPDLLSAGAIDVLLSKPMPRWAVYLAKYVGGMLLYGATLLVCGIVMYLSLRLSTGLWVHGVFRALPMNFFSAAVVYALLAVIGVLWRSATLCVVLGYAYYVIVDEVLVWFVESGRSGAFKNWKWVETTLEIMRNTMPNFALLKSVAVSSVINLPPLSATPLVTAAVWLVALLGIGIFIFDRKDF